MVPNGSKSPWLIFWQYVGGDPPPMPTRVSIVCPQTMVHPLAHGGSLLKRQNT